MEWVNFIHTESGVDLILSFAVQDRNDPMEIESLTLVRTPKFEPLVDDQERGVHVSFERHNEEEDDYLLAVEYLKAESLVRIKTNAHLYDLNVRKVEAGEIKDMCRMLHKMNFDQRFQTSGI